ncbi:Protein tyrosine kinase [Carpediemonas membranifera]|uniref:Protein tyrosine kinase n=1 Tax=Carpediemonas membranifera TaxID=201153 RepID=A0A8J6AQM6_9EUKA|nr:Protein tyrosine kinase [Carpediemonas membranifera]|eukprot:KAG9389540.1 Protein tyrosine kinase [Carpediemonas membranifera]
MVRSPRSLSHTAPLRRTLIDSIVIQSMVRPIRSLSHSKNCSFIDDQLSKLFAHNPPLHIRLIPREKTPLTITDLERVVTHLLSARIKPLSFTMTLTSPIVTVSLQHPSGELVATLRHNQVDLVLAAWNLSHRRGFSRAGNCIRTITGNSNEVVAIAYTPDSTRVVTASKDKMLAVWDAESGAHRSWMNNGGFICDIAISPDGSTVASAGDKTIKLWDLESGRQVIALEAHNDWVRGLAFSPDGKTLASCSDDKTVKLWRVSSFSTVKRVLSGQSYLSHKFQGHNKSVKCVQFVSDNILLSAGMDGRVRVWSAESYDEVRVIGFDAYTRRGIDCLAVSPDGELVATASSFATNAIELWSVKTGEHIRSLTGHARYVNCLAFSADGRLASGGWDWAIRLWNLADGSSREFKGHERVIKRLAFSPDGETLASGSGDGTAKLWDTQARSAQFSAEIDQTCRRYVTRTTDITIRSDQPVFLDDLARILVHILASNTAPRSLTVTLTHPAATITMDRGKFLVTESRSPDVLGLIVLFNKCRVNGLVTGFCSGPVSSDINFWFPPHSGADLGHLTQVIEHITKAVVNNGLQLNSFGMQLTFPRTAVVLDPYKFFTTTNQMIDEIGKILLPLNIRRLGQLVDQICKNPITAQTVIHVDPPQQWVGCRTDDLVRILNHIKKFDEVPESIKIRMVTTPPATVSLDTVHWSGLIVTGDSGTPLAKLLDEFQLEWKALEGWKLRHSIADQMVALDRALYEEADLLKTEGLLSFIHTVLSPDRLADLVKQHATQLGQVGADFERLKPARSMAKDPMPALRGKVREALERSDVFLERVATGDVRKVKQALKDKRYGAVVANIRDRAGSSPLHVAFDRDQGHVFELLLKAKCVLDFPSGPPVLGAVAKPAMLETLVKVRKVDVNVVSRNTTALVLAIQGGHWDSATFLLDNGADPLLPSVGTNAVQAVKSVADPLMTRLIRHGVDSILTRRLNKAIAHGDLELADTLLMAGAPVDGAKDGTTTPPLFTAVKTSSIHAATLLLKHGADTTLSFRGKTAAHVARKNSHLVYLLSHGADELVDSSRLNADITKPAGSIMHQVTDRIGQGGMASVFRGMYGGSECAVKVVDMTGLNAVQAARLQGEIFVHKQLRHRHVIALYALEQGDREIRLALELASGSLSALLLSKADLPWDTRLKFAREIAIAMAFIVGEGYEHRDLKSLNVLVAKETAKISDFGLTTKLSKRSKNVEGSWPWMAPERFDGVGGEKADVYAFGITLWEIAARDIPYRLEGFSLDAIRVEVCRGYRPIIPVGTPQAVANLITQCLAPNPQDRPSFAQVVASIPDNVCDGPEMYTESAVRSNKVATFAGANAPGMMTLGECSPDTVGTIRLSDGNARAPWMTLSQDERAAAFAAMGTVTATYRANMPSAPGWWTLNSDP